MLCWSSHEEIPNIQGKRNPSKMVGVARGHQRADTVKPYSQKTSQSNHIIMIIWVVKIFFVQFFCVSCHLFLAQAAASRRRHGQEEVPCIRGQWRRSGVAAGRSNPRSSGCAGAAGPRGAVPH